MSNNFKGFALFNDVEDQDLRTYNRARVLSNIFEDHSKDAKITPKGAAVFLGYFQQVPEQERAIVQQKFVSLMAERGFRIAA